MITCFLESVQDYSYYYALHSEKNKYIFYYIHIYLTHTVGPVKPTAKVGGQGHCYNSGSLFSSKLLRH